jgi:DNA polymerase-3 subunit delta
MNTMLGKGSKADAKTGAKGAPGIPDLVKQNQAVLHNLPPVIADDRSPILAQWIVKHGQEQTPKVRIDQEAAALLAKWIGGDLRRLAGEVEKLSLFAGSRTVTTADVRLLVADESEEKMWNLTDGLSARNPRMAMASLAELLLQDDKLEFMILASIASNYRTIARVKALLGRGMRADSQIAAELGMSPYAAKKAMGVAGRYTDAQLANIMDRIFQANVNMVTGGDQQTELQLLVADLTMV